MAEKSNSKLPASVQPNRFNRTASAGLQLRSIEAHYSARLSPWQKSAPEPPHFIIAITGQPQPQHDNAEPRATLQVLEQWLELELERRLERRLERQRSRAGKTASTGAKYLPFC